MYRSHHLGKGEGAWRGSEGGSYAWDVSYRSFFSLDRSVVCGPSGSYTAEVSPAPRSFDPMSVKPEINLHVFPFNRTLLDIQKALHGSFVNQTKAYTYSDRHPCARESRGRTGGSSARRDQKGFHVQRKPSRLGKRLRKQFGREIRG